jgi:hypothetical protein
VGKHGIPKYGSENETPFDRQRFLLYKQHFLHCERSAEVFMLFNRLYIYLLKREWRENNPFDTLDRCISRSNLPDKIRRNISYVQHIFFSNAHPKEVALNENGKAS